VNSHHNLPCDERSYWITQDFFDEILQVLKARQNHQRILLTFDDGNKSDLYAAERLASAGLDAKFYVITGRFGHDHHVDRDDVRDLVRAGFEVGLHGRGHIDWRSASAKELADETIESRAELADVICRPVESAAIPFGAYNRRVISHLRHQSFDRIYTSDAGPARTDSLFQPRTCLMSHHRIEDVIALMDDRVSPMARARRSIAPIIKRWR
jgi:peptidoglycan/xylan/chitin deacetylase (PgdA/CDA1 family)